MFFNFAAYQFVYSKHEANAGIALMQARPVDPSLQSLRVFMMEGSFRTLPTMHSRSSVVKSATSEAFPPLLDVAAAMTTRQAKIISMDFIFVSFGLKNV